MFGNQTNTYIYRRAIWSGGLPNDGGDKGNKDTEKTHIPLPNQSIEKLTYHNLWSLWQ